MMDGSIVEIANISTSPETSFEMDPLSMIPFLTFAKATWHTHPCGPSGYSGEDHKGFLQWPKLYHHVISPDGVRTYRVENGAVLECD